MDSFRADIKIEDIHEDTKHDVKNWFEKFKLEIEWPFPWEINSVVWSIFFGLKPKMRPYKNDNDEQRLKRFSA